MSDECLHGGCRFSVEETTSRPCVHFDVCKKFTQRIEALEKLFEAVRSQWSDTEDGATHDICVDDDTGEYINLMQITMGRTAYDQIGEALAALGHDSEGG